MSPQWDMTKIVEMVFHVTAGISRAPSEGATWSEVGSRGMAAKYFWKLPTRAPAMGRIFEPLVGGRRRGGGCNYLLKAICSFATADEHSRSDLG